EWRPRRRGSPAGRPRRPGERRVRRAGARERRGRRRPADPGGERRRGADPARPRTRRPERAGVDATHRVTGRMTNRGDPPLMHDVTLDADQLERIWQQARIWSRVAVPRRDAMMACWPAPRGRVRRADDGEDTLVRVVYGLAVGAVPADQSVQRAC